MNPIADLLTNLRSGTMTLDEVADHFRQRKWERARQPESDDYQDRAEYLDPGLPVAGSIDEVTAAYDRGELTSEQYDVLAEAVADAIRGEGQSAE